MPCSCLACMKIRILRRPLEFYEYRVTRCGGQCDPSHPLRHCVVHYGDSAAHLYRRRSKVVLGAGPALACGACRRNCFRGSRICCRNNLSLDGVGGPAPRREFRIRLHRTLGTSDNVLPTSHLGLHSGLHCFRDNCRLDLDCGSSDKTYLNLAACAKSTALLRLGFSPPHPPPPHRPADHTMPSCAATRAPPSAAQARADRRCASTG